MGLARKAIKQRFQPSDQMLSVMESFRQMVNDCIRIGLQFEEENGGRTPSMKKLSLLSYGELRDRYGGFAQYSLGAISKAAGILSARRKSIRRGIHTKTPYLSRPLLVSCYGFRIEDNNLIIHIDSHAKQSIELNAHTLALISDPASKVRSFTLARESFSLCIARQIKETNHEQITGTVGIDRNLRNVTVGNLARVTQYDVTKIVEIGENTRSIVHSFSRLDLRVRREIASKYGKRQSRRTKQLFNLISKKVVGDAKASNQAIVFEEIAGMKMLYRRRDGHSRSFRARMSSWPYYEIKRQIEYKAAWQGVPVITLTKSETRGTTMDCPRCGERLQVPVRGDSGHYRQLWCEECKRWTDRDVVAVLNISHRGWLRFDHSQRKEGEAREAVKGNVEPEGEPLILKVDASKLHQDELVR